MRKEGTALGVDVIPKAIQQQEAPGGGQVQSRSAFLTKGLANSGWGRGCVRAKKEGEMS